MLARRATLVAAMMSTASLVVAVALPVFAGVGAARTYKVDGAHSSVIFRVKHMDTGYFQGRFNDISGTIGLDDQNLGQSSVEITIRTGSIDTAIPKRDTHLKGPDFFNAKQYPSISFKSKSLSKTGKDAYEVQGDLTLHGQTRPVVVKLEQTGQKANPKGGARVGFESVLNIKRSDFGMDKMLDAVSDEVRITIDMEATNG